MGVKTTMSWSSIKLQDNINAKFLGILKGEPVISDPLPVFCFSGNLDSKPKRISQNICIQYL